MKKLTTRLKVGAFFSRHKVEGSKPLLQSLTAFLIMTLPFAAPATADTMNKYSDAISEYYRDRTFTLTAQPVGYGPTNTLTYGLNAGAYVGGGLVQLEFTNNLNYDPVKLTSDTYTDADANGNSSSSSSMRWKSEVKAYSVGVQYKKFLHKSFYVKGGIVYRNVQVTEKYIEPGAEDTIGFDGISYAATVAVGHQWNIKAFTIGCDWAGWVQPFSTKISSETYTSNTTSYGRQRVSDGIAKYVTGGSLQLVRLYLGASF